MQTLISVSLRALHPGFAIVNRGSGTPGNAGGLLKHVEAGPPGSGALAQERVITHLFGTPDEWE